MRESRLAPVFSSSTVYFLSLSVSAFANGNLMRSAVANGRMHFFCLLPTLIAVIAASINEKLRLNDRELSHFR